MTVSNSELTLRNRTLEEARVNRLYAFGTADIFQRRAARLRKKLNILNYIGIAVPLLVGATVMSFGPDIEWLSIVGIVGATVLLGQIAVSLWSLIAGWVDQHAHANESVTVNNDLVRRYDELLGGRIPVGQLKTQFGLVLADDHNRRALDTRQNPAEKEKRRGMRAALRHYQQRCATCKQMPTSLKPSDCDTCGNF
ncbi:mobilome CxxCx(11)CxxC protein [Micromonospora sp. 4G55]|uniref:mobilome CxxCx(11)CxxC protein n=1 Tax=Micromonospora sp. 4G55 TaxID=2806102 RepID=UPI001A63DBF6|nr:mobilome CxxCx(11)CxxC protein [Micromonospora sp. 4G55]MBM0258804.1 hypothetical protein [Micromonospora sp. 4G55]